MNALLIKLFNAALPEKSKSSCTFAAVNAEAIQRGYIVEPDACTDSVLAFLKDQTINPNATFYKTWEDVLSKTRFELFIDQVFHYMSTYGTDFSCGNGYVPTDGDVNVQTTFTNFKVIKAITPEELYNRCLGMLTSGIALNENTMYAVANYVVDYASDNNIEVNVDAIKNREALVYICNELNVAPQEKFNLFRYIIYVTTGKTMIIKNKEMITAIKTSQNQFDFRKLSEKNLVSLSSIFLRYKDLFLAFKNSEKTVVTYEGTGWRRHSVYNVVKTATVNAPIINKLRKLAVKNHQPMGESFWQTLFSKPKTEAELIAHLDEITTYKKVALMQTCLERSIPHNDQFYLIRNQKMFMRANYSVDVDQKYAMLVYAVLRKSIVDTLRTHSTKTVSTVENGETVEKEVPVVVKTVNGMSVALPTSEKSFIGNYPFGTSYDMLGHNYIGCYWRNEWGTKDYDLSLIDIRGGKIGWNSAYYNREDSVVYSGDMTNADPEACELLYISDKCPVGIITVNQYWGDPKSKFRMLFGQEQIKNVSKNYMVDPSTIKLSVDVPITGNETQIGVTTGTKAVLMAVNTGNKRVSRNTADYVNAMTDSIIRKTMCFVDSADLLKDAGFEVVDETYSGDVDIDYANLDKDSLLSLMV